MDVGQFLRDYGGHALGFLGLAQVWAIALWKRFFIRGQLAVYETANIELGFSGFGPTVTLLGTLRASHKDVFVRRMRVRVIRKSDKAEHTFTWRAFRPSSVTLGAKDQQSLEIAGSFLVSTRAPRQYNVFFASAAFGSQYEAYVQPLRDKWYGFVDEKVREVNQNLAGQISRVLENPALSAELFDQFMKAGHATELHTAVSNGFFWHAGSYELEFKVETDRSREDITRRWQFTLLPDDEKNFRLNIITLIRELCNLPIVYSFAYKDYSAIGPAV